jgi:hypothetical protein
MADQTLHVPELKSLDWRLDVRVSRRSAYNVMEPYFSIRVVVDDGAGKEKVEWLEVDAATLKHMSNEVEAALRESRTRHARRVVRMLH